jgi:hypothetical protein
MSKYIWKCESSSCGNEFKAENPNQCPDCGKDDIRILREDDWLPPITDKVKKILIAGVGIIAIGLVIYNWDKIFQDDDGTKVGNITTYTLKIVEHNNYFEINGADVDELELYVENSLSSKKLYSDGNKFYPCEDGDFLIKWEEQEDVKIEGPKKIKNFKLSVEPHENACEEQLAILDIDVRSSDCRYTIMTNMDDDPNIEVSLRENNGYQEGKLVWELSEINGATHFYVRLKGSYQNVKKRIPSCKVPIAVEAPKAAVVVASFELYTNNIENNRTQFTDLISKYNADIVYKGQQMQIMDFIMQIRTEVRNNGDAFLGSLKLTQNNVFYNSDKTKITKLKITQ